MTGIKVRYNNPLNIQANRRYCFLVFRYSSEICKVTSIRKIIQTVLYNVCKLATSSTDKGKPCSYTTPTINNRDAR